MLGLGVLTSYAESTRELRAPEGGLVEPCGQLWAAFSPASGETTLLNDVAAALLETIRESPTTSGRLAEWLAAQAAATPEEAARAVEEAVAQLEGAGLAIAGD